MATPPRLSRLNLPNNTHDFPIELGPNTPPQLRLEYECMRAGRVQPIPEGRSYMARWLRRQPWWPWKAPLVDMGLEREKALVEAFRAAGGTVRE